MSKSARPLGITIRFAATGKSLTGPQGETFDLGAFDRGQTRTCADMIADAMGLARTPHKPAPRSHQHTHRPHNNSR